MKLRDQMKKESEADNEKHMEEQAAIFQAQLNIITAASQQSRDTSNGVMSELQGRLASTVTLSEDLQRTKDLQERTLSEAQAATARQMENQNRVFSEKLAQQDRDHQRKIAQEKQDMEAAALGWKKQLEKEMEEKAAFGSEQLRIANQTAQEATQRMQAAAASAQSITEHAQAAAVNMATKHEQILAERAAVFVQDGRQ